MNVQQINGTGGHILGFVATALFLIVIAFSGWYLAAHLRESRFRDIAKLVSHFQDWNKRSWGSFLGTMTKIRFGPSRNRQIYERATAERMNVV